MRCTGLEKPPEGDIISEYKWLFIGFVILQVTNWSLALLEVFRALSARWRTPRWSRPFRSTSPSAS